MKIFCAEALWDNEISQNRASYKSLLDLVRNETGCRLAYFTFNTPEELDHLFEMFGKKNYDIFYLASHMEGGEIKSGYNDKYRTDYVAIAERHSLHLKNKILHLAGCSSLKGSNIGSVKDLLENTELSAISGYIIDTDTVESSAMDMIYLTTVIRDGMTEFKKNLKKRYDQLAKTSGFKIYTR